MKSFKYLPLAVLIFFVLCFSQKNYCQYYAIRADANYAEAPIQKGLPEIEPGKYFGFKIKDPYFAWINPVAGFVGIYFIEGRNPSGKEDYRVLTVNSSGITILYPVVITSGNSDGFYGYSLIDLHLRNSYGFELNFYYSGQNKLLKYSWPSNINVNGAFVPVPFVKIGSKINVALIPFIKKNINPDSLRNKTIFLNWILNSKGTGGKSLSQFNSLYKKYSGIKNLVFISVGAEKNFTKGTGNYFSIKADSSARSFLGSSYPLNLIINNSGKVVYSKLGFNKSFSDNLSKILNNYKKN